MLKKNACSYSTRRSLRAPWIGRISLKQRCINSERCLLKTPWILPALGWMAASQKRYIYPEPVNVTLFGERIFASLIKDLKMRSPWIILWILNPMTSILIQERWGRFETLWHMERIIWRWGREQSDGPTSPGTPGVARSWKRQDGSSPRASEGSVVLLAPRLQTTDLQSWERINISCFKPRNLW